MTGDGRRDEGSTCRVQSPRRLYGQEHCYFSVIERSHPTETDDGLGQNRRRGATWPGGQERRASHA